nr:ABC transporter ATP-binding protein [Aquamicrobium sp. NLF2-7]
MPQPLLELDKVCIDLQRDRDDLRIVDGVSLNVGEGEIVGIVGESGCGKSLTAFSILDLFPSAAVRVSAGHILFRSNDLRTMEARGLRRMRGRDIGMVFQDPSSFLDPLMRVGDQVGQALRVHGYSGNVSARIEELLALTELPDPAGVARKYPHELSGGMRQRVLIAAALAMNPALLIADEPTTALDVTVQKGILQLLLRLRDELGLSILLITHDLGVIAETCDRVYVMYAGRVVETAGIYDLFENPRHPYTQGLLKSTLPVLKDDAALFSIPGRVPNPRAFPTGCRFNPRCPLSLADPCEIKDPLLVFRDPDSADACWRSDEAVAKQAWSHVEQ